MSGVSFPRDTLPEADLVIDAVYMGTRAGNAGDDPLGPLLGVSNQGGFRHLGKRGKPNLLVITTSMKEPDWPDHLDPETGLFTYYGDNREPGLDLHSTPRWGNEMLRDLFNRTHADPPRRNEVPPVLVFRTAGVYRDVRFLGLAVPGARGIPSTQDLVAGWHLTRGQRFQNYRAVFTILDVSKLSRAWLRDIQRGNSLSSNAPAEWRSWVDGGQPTPLRSQPTIPYRKKEEQLPAARDEVRRLQATHQKSRNSPSRFESTRSASNERHGDYDVALSFAGEDRRHASAIAKLLCDAGVSVFYDEYVDLWGKNLYTHLSDVYQNRARFCVVIISKNYSLKLWTRRELEAAQARAFRENREYVLPLRLDDTPIVGIEDTIAYLDLRKVSHREVATQVILKLREAHR